jgi:hypothetical protein
MQRVFLTVLGITLTLCFAPQSQAQNPTTTTHQHSSTSPPPQHQHNVAATNLIDGAVHPELISDSIAYRLYLVAVSTRPNPDEAEQTIQRVQVMRTGLVDTDQQTFISILSDFRANYDALVADYNAAAKADNTTDVHTLLKKLDDLVQSTRDTIEVRLSARGAAKLHAFVVSEKKNMRTTEEN